ncbi:alpha/beta fold hydrolase [Vibrio tapetis subsp. quintayensis]|uniref:alpha/beta fold hydrolase n=1 Tax=Vibrio tapetis TaxID=52443 RepID=UPI0025B442A0|nr:alpha/beta fold hydrolase [Vibrio tapetis]MDN3680273.1 alpha/beta fold hydrolase [Vibrio tapetis subsp. quintayensis]
MKIVNKWLVGLIILISVGCANVSNDQTNLKQGDELVVLAHGLARSGSAMWKLAQRIEEAGYHVCVIDYSTIGKSLESTLTQTESEIDNCLQNDNRVHFVGHSLGGLVIRSYLETHKELQSTERLGQVVFMGTPNHGSEVADHFDGRLLMDIAGGTSQSLVTGERSLGEVIAQPDYQAGVIAGTNSNGATNRFFDGPNDGLVSVDSTKVANMKDFITIEVGHSIMRYDEVVANQTIHFLNYGVFDHTNAPVQ